jgi:F-type H+-transporting ATPase subunit a
MPEHELWVTSLLNRYFAGVANAVLSLVGVHADNPVKPWANYVAMQVVVALFVIIFFALLRLKLSSSRPGKIQQSFEVVYQFLEGQAQEIVSHGGSRYMHFFATIFLFVLFGNLLGVIPTFESPTMFAPVPLGCALAVFGYYHLMGIQAQGLKKYLAHFAGPMPFLAPLIIPIEIISHLGRLLSLTVRLYANMFAGEQVILIFLSITYLVIPSLFMGLHVFVAFVQAFVFSLLAMIYVSMGVAEEH